MIDAADTLISVWSNCEGLHDLTSTNYYEALQYSTEFTIERDDGNEVSKQGLKDMGEVFGVRDSLILIGERSFVRRMSLIARCHFLRVLGGDLVEVADSDVFKCFKNNVGNFDIPELRDANLADTPSSQYCTLILTKGDYAKDIAMSRLSVVGQDKYGVFPLKGELLNVREASPEQLEKNTQIQNIKKILGLQDGKIYENVNELRYGHLMIMADEDDDGLQMKGLLINFLHFFWPSLLKVKSFLQMFIAPIIKASHKKTNKVFLFYSTPEYEAWCKKEKLKNNYNIKYYEDFSLVNDEDDNAIELVFSNKKIEARKRWLLEPEDVTLFDPTQKCIRYLDFINQDFKQYAMADLEKSIPSMVDGLKPHQRKILFYAFKMPIIQRTQVDHFCSYVFEHSPYDLEGEASLVSTIIGMAQNYVGSNNINLLQPNGQFGTRVMGGKDHGVGTLLFTQLSPITPYLFHKDDQLLLNYLNEGGQSIEPACLVANHPIVLVKRKEAKIYKKFLDALSRGGSDIKAYKAYKARHDTTSVHFKITMSEDQINGAIQEGIHHKFKLKTTLSTADMHLFDKNDELKKYHTPKQILEDFFHLRLDFYEKRRTTLLCKLKKDVLVVENKLSFIKEVRNLDLALKSKDERCAELKTKGFKSLPSIAREVDGVGREETQEEQRTGYDYLLSIPLLTLEAKDMKELEDEQDAMNKKIAYLQDASIIKSLWLTDLHALEKQLVLVRNETLKDILKQILKQKKLQNEQDMQPDKARTRRDVRRDVCKCSANVLAVAGWGN
ncbi:DNA topoisomerase 2 [Tanacetum coccineum]